MLIPKGFTELLKFPSVRGNQEERIIYITETDEPLRKSLIAMPEVIEIEKRSNNSWPSMEMGR